MQYVLTDGSIDEDCACDDVPKECWLENQKTIALLAMIVMRGSPALPSPETQGRRYEKWSVQ
jgi:hypothetical protein